MFCLIEFKDNLVITKEEAKELGVRFEENHRLGKSVDDGSLGKLDSWSYYEDELKYKEKEDLDEGEREGYYKDDERIGAYNVYERLDDDKNYVFVPMSTHLVRLQDFAPKCNYKYYILQTVLEKGEK